MTIRNVKEVVVEDDGRITIHLWCGRWISVPEGNDLVIMDHETIGII